MKRASLSIALNIAEGTGKFTNADKKHFYRIARGSVYECVAILEIMGDNQVIDQDVFDSLYKDFENISKMLFGLINAV